MSREVVKLSWESPQDKGKSIEVEPGGSRDLLTPAGEASVLFEERRSLEETVVGIVAWLPGEGQFSRGIYTLFPGDEEPQRCPKQRVEVYQNGVEITAKRVRTG